jgi:xylulokinase
MRGKSARDADQLLLGTRPGAGGIVMLPFFNGERTPNLPHARACIFGLDPSNAGAANLMRAAMEGATYGLRGGMEAFSDAGLRFERVRLTGGGSRSAIWRQMVADIFETTVEVPAQPEGAAFGAALQALWADQRSQGDARGMAEALHEHVGIEEGSACTPDPGAVEQYRAAHGRFRNFLATMCRHDQA